MNEIEAVGDQAEKLNWRDRQRSREQRRSDLRQDDKCGSDGRKMVAKNTSSGVEQLSITIQDNARDKQDWGHPVPLRYFCKVSGECESQQEGKDRLRRACVALN